MQRSFEVIAGAEPARAPGFTPVTSSMDVPRPDVARKKKKKRILIGAGSLLGLILITVVVARLKPAAMSVDRGPPDRRDGPEATPRSPPRAGPS